MPLGDRLPLAIIKAGACQCDVGRLQLNQRFTQQARCASGRGGRVVQLMGQASGQFSECRHLFSLPQLGFYPATNGYIHKRDHAPNQLAVPFDRERPVLSRERLRGRPAELLNDGEFRADDGRDGRRV
jgi:hypothetical protein